MPGTIRVGRPNRISHIPLSWDVSKARSNHEPKFRPVGDAILRGRERTVGQVMEEMFAAMPSPEPWITGRMTEGRYLVEAQKVAEPYVTRIAEILQPTFNEGALLGQDRIRASMNEQLRRLGSPLRLTDADGKVTKATANPQMVGGVRVGRSPKAEWAAVGVEAFDSVNTASVDYAKFRSGTLVTNMLEEQQRVIRDLIGESFTVQQTFQAVGDFPARTVTGLTAQQTSKALVDVLQEMSPRTSISQNLATFRGVNAAGLTHPWERAVYHRAESMATALSKQGVTGRAAYTKIQKDSQRYANKLRRSRARMISRTEIKRAQVQGQLSAMRQAVNDGLADPKTAGKKWVTGATDVCNICSDLGFGKPILLDQSFHGVGDGPPAHPNCRCDLDFAHTLSSAPIPHGAGDKNYPAGTQQNPIVWEFPSGFQTQPSVTTTFKPPGFIPPPTIPVTQPPPSVPAPSAPPRGPQAAYDELAEIPPGPSMADSVMYSPTAKTAKVVDPVVDQMDSVLAAPTPYSSGPTSITIRTTGKRGEDGFFSPKKPLRTPSEPRRPYTRAGYGSDAEYEAAIAKYEAAFARYRERLDEFRAQKGVRSQIEVMSKSGREQIDATVGSMQNSLGHEWGHRLDYVEEIIPASGRGRAGGFERTRHNSRMTQAAEEVGAAAVSGQFPAEIAFLEAAAESEAVATLVRLCAEIDAKWTTYATSPEELWARAFSQWMGTRHGTAEMMADMAMEQTKAATSVLTDVATQYHGFQWRAAEFDETIAPLVEDVLRSWGYLT